MMHRKTKDNWDRFLLWVDGVGGYWVCTRDDVSLGQPRSIDEPAAESADIPIYANLSRRHAWIRRDGELYMLDPLRETVVDGTPIHEPVALNDGSVIGLGDSLALSFRCPHPLSTTARLDILSRHNTRPSVYGILLMAGSCVAGPGSDRHIPCFDWPEDMILSYRNGQLRCRGPQGMKVNAKRCPDGRALLTSGARVESGPMSFCVEMIGE